MRCGEVQIPCPPMALGVDVGSCFKQDIQHLSAAHSHNHRRVKGGDRFIDLRFQLWSCFEQPGEQGSVAFVEGLLQQFSLWFCGVAHGICCRQALRGAGSPPFTTIRGHFMLAQEQARSNLQVWISVDCVTGEVTAEEGGALALSRAFTKNGHPPLVFAPPARRNNRFSVLLFQSCAEISVIYCHTRR